jgi:uncharacterized protein
MKKHLLPALFIIFLIGYFTYRQVDKKRIIVVDNVGQGQQEKVYASTISIDYLRSLNIDAKAPETIEELTPGSNYKRYIVSYISEGNKIHGLLTVPNENPPEGGYSAVVFNHGYIPPNQYVTTEKYVAYVDYLARNGFVVFKIDMRGNGDSEGMPIGSYFSPGYTVDAISALKSLQKLDYVNKDRIGIWGHSMAGNLVLRAMLVEDEVKAGVIWAGAVYSYEDFAEYRLNDGSYVRRGNDPHYDTRALNRGVSSEITKLRENPKEVNYTSGFWKEASLTSNINYLNFPVQLHHATNDPTVNVGYSRDLEKVLKENNKQYEYYEYSGGGHNIDSPYFEQAMQRTVEFFKTNL